MIRTGEQVPEGFSVRTDAVVIGSGAGGGVAAALLAEAGREVWVLEEGPHVPSDRMTQREEQMYPLLYRDGGEQRTDDGGVSVLQGRVVGGSTVVNMADVVGIRDEVWAHWRRVHGLDRYDRDDLAEAETACRDAIGANPIAESAWNRNNAHLAAGARRLGQIAGSMDHNRVDCLGSGYCLVGCAYGAKRSVALTWIPRALDTGRAVVQAEARVRRLEHDGGRIVAAVGDVIRPADGRALAPFRIEADTFVLSAGAIHSPVLLQHSGLGGSAVGHHLTLQPQAPVAAVFPDEVGMFRGIPQAAYVDCEVATAEEGLGGFRIEAVSATPGMAAVTTALDTDDLHRFMASFRRASACLCLVPDRPTGRVTVDRKGRPRIRYAVTPRVAATLIEAIGLAARCWLAAGAEAVALPFPGIGMVRSEADLARLADVEIRPSATPMISAHPQGTCRMGTDPRRSVVGLDHRVHGTINLYVLDASVFPTSASSHTQLPVMAMSWLGARSIVAG